MASSPDGVVYAYINVGLETTLTDEGVVYEYLNVGVKPDPNWIGRIVGLAGPRTHGVTYEYVNIGTGSGLEEDEGIVYEYINVT